MITLSHTGTFKEFMDKGGNRVVGLPDHFGSLFNSEWSPIRTYLQTVSPDCEISVQVIVQVGKPKSK